MNDGTYSKNKNKQTKTDRRVLMEVTRAQTYITARPQVVSRKSPLVRGCFVIIRTAWS